MSYQQSGQSTILSSLLPNRVQSPPAPSYAIHRKPPAANYSPIPHPPATPQTSVSQQSVSTPSVNDQAPGAPITSSSSTTTAPLSPRGPITPESTTSNNDVVVSPSSTVPAHTGTLSQAEVDAALRSCVAVLNDAITYHSKLPFSAVLLAPDNVTVLVTHNAVSCVQHAESELARVASLQYSTRYLNRCTLVSTWEPCAMCAGTIYWSGIGRVLYAASEKTLKELTGPNNDEYPTMDLPCRLVLHAGQRRIEVIGPVARWEEKVIQTSQQWWDEQRGIEGITSPSQSRIGLAKFQYGTGAAGSLTTITPDDSMLGSIGDDGEYQADLKVDWMY